LDDLSNSGPAVRLYREGRAARPPEDATGEGEIMTQYLVAIHHPDDYDPSAEDEAMSRDIDVLNDEMVAAGVRTFVGGLLFLPKTPSNDFQLTVTLLHSEPLVNGSSFIFLIVADFKGIQAAKHFGEGQAAKIISPPKSIL
jgi:hypothetical protein